MKDNRENLFNLRYALVGMYLTSILGVQYCQIHLHDDDDDDDDDDKVV